MFNNAAQAWNHSFYWDCMKPGGGGNPRRPAAAVDRDFGGYEAFRKAMSEAAVKLFGSGWAWLASDKKGKLEIMPLGNADTPLKHNREPLLTIDVWEHAYYVDYHNERNKYDRRFLERRQLALRRQVSRRREGVKTRVRKSGESSV